MRKRLRVITALLFGLVLAASGTGIALAASITDLHITDATLNPKTKVATVSAIVTCSETLQVRVFSVIFQAAGRNQASYAGGTEITCSPTPTTVTVENTELLDSARLRPGSAHVNVFVESIASPGDTFLGASEDLRIGIARP